MAWKQKFPNQCTLLSNCNTDLVERMREAFPSEFHYSGNRAVSLDLATDVPEFPTRAVVAMALTYHCDRAGRKAVLLYKNALLHSAAGHFLRFEKGFRLLLSAPGLDPFSPKRNHHPHLAHAQSDHRLPCAHKLDGSFADAHECREG